MRKSVISLFLDNMNEGGVQRATVNLARGFVALNIEVDIVLLNNTGPFIKQLPKGVSCHNDQPNY